MRKSNFCKLAGISAALVLSSGCASSRTVTNLEEYLPKEEFNSEYLSTTDELLQHYFTTRAYDALKDIPLIDGLGHYAAGVTVWSNLLSFFTFNGVGRKVVLESDMLKKVWANPNLKSNLGSDGMCAEVVVHEYIHHLDDLDRDGDSNPRFIDLDEFKEAYLKLANDSIFAGITLWVERRYNDYAFISDNLGVGELSEHVAYIGQYIADGLNVPNYMKRVFRNVLNKNILNLADKDDNYQSVDELTEFLRRQDRE